MTSQIDKNKQVPSQGTFLEKNAMLVKLNRHKFNHNAMDKELSAKVMKECKAKGKNTIRVNKTIIDKANCKKWMDIFNEAGKYFYKVTLPWDDKGWRLLPVVKYKEFVKKFRNWGNDVQEAIDHFVQNLDKYIDEGMANLGTAGHKADYPDQQKVRESFVFKVEYNQIASGNDFRAQVTEEERQDIVKHITGQNVAKFAMAQESIFNRIHEVAKKLSEKMAEPAPKGKKSPEFRDSIIGNIQELVDVLPDLNVNGNKTLEELTAKLSSQLATLDPEDLRECDRLREDTKSKADEIMKQAEGFMS
jgi:hypothetical protein